jgi:endonuclease G, mitochondrial
MAKLRTNHSRQEDGSGMIIKVGLFGAIVGGLFFLFNLFMGNEGAGKDKAEVENTAFADEYFLPASTTGQIINHQFFSLSYSEEHEQAEWTAHVLTKENLERPWNDRRDNFMPDPGVKTGSATPDDYRNSGYDRGHLVPAADMAFSEEAMQESFLMSNISPQARNFNKGIWRELEELTRGWAKKNHKLYVATGPVLSLAPKGAIGENNVTIPAAYFKVLLDITEPELKGIGFIIPNEVCFEPLYKFTVSIDEVERVTGLDFFPELMPAELEKQIESQFNIDLWEFSKSKYELRLEKWNQEQ